MTLQVCNTRAVTRILELQNKNSNVVYQSCWSTSEDTFSPQGKPERLSCFTGSILITEVLKGEPEPELDHTQSTINTCSSCLILLN